MGRRRKRLTRPLLHIHNCKPALEIERAAYFGGRCDVFQMGRIDSDVYVLDVNSLYPAMMQKYKYPVKLLAVEQGPSISDLERWCENEAVCATVSIRSRGQTYPYRDHTGVRHVLGDFVTALAGSELLRCVRAGNVHCAYACCRYRTGDLFSQYVESLYTERLTAEREKGDGAGDPYKLLLNSLYGKFAQHRETWLSVDTVPPIDLWAEWSHWDRENKVAHHYRSMAGKVEECIKEGEWLHSFPAVAAHVTAYGREYMRELITIAGIENVYYTDTDSIHCSHQGRSRLQSKGLIREGSIGLLRLDTEASEAEYRGRRYYRLGAECTVSGAKFSPNAWCQGRVQNDRVRGARSVLRYGAKSTIEHKMVDLQYHDRHMRGAVLPDGRVLPEVIGNGQMDVDEGAL